MIAGVADALSLVERLGAPPRLLTHLRLVVEAAQHLVRGYERLQIPFDAEAILLGAALHDAGKVLFPEELDRSGSRHEEAGESLLLQHGVPARVARCCVTHAAWRLPQVSFEERSVALADKLWKGRRESELELLVVDEAAAKRGADRWQLFAPLDTLFEEIAAEGPSRLERSR